MTTGTTASPPSSARSVRADGFGPGVLAKRAATTFVLVPVRSGASGAEQSDHRGLYHSPDVVVEQVE